ncbi:MAG: acyl carrier protein, partial [Actinocatenispora sp.]
MLLALDASMRPVVVSAEIRRRLGDLLGVPVADVPLDAPLAGLGMESLRAIELRDALQRDTGVDIAMASFLRSSPGQLAASICAALDTATPATENTATSG